jgi:uncharacterized protein
MVPYFCIERNKMTTILKGTVGSHAFGTATPDSDKDIMEVFVANYSHYMGIHKETTSYQTIKDGSDTTQYELQTFLKLCLDGNPNVLPMLWIAKCTATPASYFAEKLCIDRDCFLSRKCITKFLGYGYSQLEKIDKGTTGKMGKQRKNLYEQLGFDTKAASHSLRLARVARELSLFGQMIVNRQGLDADELLAIRAGEVKLPELKRMIESTLANAKEHIATSPLPQEPYYERINYVCIDLLDTIFGNNQGL